MRPGNLASDVKCWIRAEFYKATKTVSWGGCLWRRFFLPVSFFLVGGGYFWNPDFLSDSGSTTLKFVVLCQITSEEILNSGSCFLYSKIVELGLQAIF